MIISLPFVGTSDLLTLQLGYVEKDLADLSDFFLLIEKVSTKGKFGLARKELGEKLI